MAAAEARAAWQRANRCFVQEDAKRAPKLASRQSSNSSTKQVDTSGPVNGTDYPDHPSVGFSPFNRTPAYSNLPPDAKWWLQMEPSYMHRRGLNTDHINNTSPNVEPAAIMSEDSVCSVDYDALDSFLDVEKYAEVGRLEEANLVDQDFVDVKKMTDYYDLLEMEMIGGSKQSGDISSSADSSWVEGGQKVPWWRVTDEEELASFVAHKSLLRVENCDLPPPQKTKVRNVPCKQGSFKDHDEILVGSSECEAMFSPSSGDSQQRHWSSVKGESSRNESVATEPLRSNNLDKLDKGRVSLDDPGKAKLLEALCHSQTRAREAEKAAKQAFTEKEHILKLFFRQASQLFAYKQWFKLLQLENLILQNGKNNFLDILPQMPSKPENPRKTWQKSSKTKRRKRASQENDIGKYTVAFAVGFTLVGAGLILGWTVGWLLPVF